MTDVDVFCADPRGRLLGPVVSGEMEVLKVIERFDSGASLLLPDDAPAPAPTLLLQPSPAQEPAASAPLATPRRTPSRKTPLVYSRRSARLKAAKPAIRQTMLEKATLLKKQKLNGKAPAKSKGLLPSVELLEVATNELAPLPRKDVLQLAEACDISEIDLNKVAPEVIDV
ncbi:hypothetical protein D1007_16368 [Hordeum vulgare]|nr:hypothetical protein D1007_16368 [Hordeum vulgare]